MKGELIKKIADFLNTTKLAEIEEVRLTQDLENVFLRLQRREYQKFNPSRNVFHIQDRWQSFMVEIDFYCTVGRTWASILKAVDAHTQPNIVDLCPGYAPKIELGLFYLGYQGIVTLLNKDAKVSDELGRFLRLFNPSFEIRKINADIFHDPLERAPLVVANHILDDLVIDYFCTRFDMKADEIYQKEENFSGFWRKIDENKKENIAELAPFIQSVIRRTVEPGGTFVITHYQSYIERILDVKEAVSFNRDLLKIVMERLCKEDFKDASHLASQALKDTQGPIRAEECHVLKRKAPWLSKTTEITTR